MMHPIYMFILVFIIAFGGIFYLLSLTHNPFTIAMLFASIIAFQWVKNRE